MISQLDFSDICGQHTMKRGLEIAAAGMHHTMLIGPPGAGKSMAARRLPTILPKMTWEECLEVSEIYSAAGLLKPAEGLITTRPFRSPHHTASDVALAGGGRLPKPGEISLAHRGVLFLDELTEFSSCSHGSNASAHRDRPYNDQSFAGDVCVSSRIYAGGSD